MRYVSPRPRTERHEQLELHSGYTENDRQIQRSQVTGLVQIVALSDADTITEAHMPPLARGRAKTRWTQPFWRIII